MTSTPYSEKTLASPSSLETQIYRSLPEFKGADVDRFPKAISLVLLKVNVYLPACAFRQVWSRQLGPS